MQDNYYKLRELILKNFKGSSSELKILFNGRETFIIGLNGSGKSMIGRGIQFLFSGSKTFFDNKYRMDMISNNAKGLEVSGELVNEKTGNTIQIKSKLSENDNYSLKIDCSEENVELTKDDLSEMIDSLFFRPMKIASLSAKKQALLLGVDTTKYDSSIALAKKNLKPYRADVKRLKTLIDGKEEPEKVEEITWEDLYNEKTKIEDFNRLQDTKARDVQEKGSEITERNQEILELEEKLIIMKESLKAAKEELANLPMPENKKSTASVEQKLTNASKINEKAKKYQEYSKTKTELTKYETKFTENEKLVTEAEKNKLEYIKSCKLPFPNLKFDDEGGLMISAFDYADKGEYAYLNEDFYSTGQIVKISVGIMVNKIITIGKEHNIVPLLLIDDADNLDDKNIEYIRELSQKYDIQVAYLFVRKPESVKGGIKIMIEEKAIKEYIKPK
jgi:hypothetical protein